MKPADAALAEKSLQWIRVAEEDLLSAEAIFKLKSGIPYRAIAFHAQQCAEKYIKAFLVLMGLDFPYTHDISRLLRLLPFEKDSATKLFPAGPFGSLKHQKRIG